MKIEASIKVERRKGFWWDVLFWVMFFTVGPLQIAVLWIGKGFTVLSDLLRELCYRAWFKTIVK